MNFYDNVNSEYKALLNDAKKEKRLGMHSFHRYYGKLIPAIPRAYIRNFTEEEDIVFDPFSGSGTVALEAKYLNREFVGVEINPLSVMISKVKTENYDIECLNSLYDHLKELVYSDNNIVNDEEVPFCINRDHWFKNYVQHDLVKIERNIPIAVEDVIESLKEQKKYTNFLYGVLSAIIKQVSNSDTMHVFPGISKRMRKLEAEGKININVFETYFRCLKKRISYVEELENKNKIPTIINDDSAKVDLSIYNDKIDLIVTNPPYISSVRYAETLKLELYWMEVTKNQKEYCDLSKSMIGNDHISSEDCRELYLTNYEFINEYIKKLFEIDKKQAKVVYDFFTLMEKVIKNMHYVLKKGKKVVMKISDSRIRKIIIPTGKLLTMIAELNGFKFIDNFNDKINENSRSLLTARNTYSGIILEDNIIVWEKK